MLDLPITEKIIFASAAAAYLAAAVTGLLQLRPRYQRCKMFLVPLVALASLLVAFMLVFRAAQIKAIPLTGTFESLMVLTIVFALIFMLFASNQYNAWYILWFLPFVLAIKNWHVRIILLWLMFWSYEGMGISLLPGFALA